jgi:hypothetical protein
VDIVSDPILSAQKPRCYNRIMTQSSRSFATLTDRQLLSEVSDLSMRDRQLTARLIAGLAEVDARRLYLGEGFSSLFTYCTGVLRMSEHAAYARIEVARAARRFPNIVDRLEEGSLTLTTACLLARHLTHDNHVAVIDAARYKTKRDVEVQIAALSPQPPVPASVRKQPTAAAPPSVPATAEILPAASSKPPAVVKPLSPERYKVQLTITRETHGKLRLTQDLLRHSIPDGDLGAIFDRALSLLLKELQRSKLGHAERPRRVPPADAASRHVPAGVRREVWSRDQGQCAFVGTIGRCSERGLLEFHHVVPFSDRGPTTTANLQLRCRAHNQHEARDLFGDPEAG